MANKRPKPEEIISKLRQVEVSEPLRHVPFEAVGTGGASEDVGGQFRHRGIHAVIVTPSLGSFKWQGSQMLKRSVEK